MTRTLIAIPTFENITPETFKSVYELSKPAYISKVDFTFVKGYDCARARNKICEKALEDGYNYILMVDSDVILPRETLISFFSNPENMPELILGLVPKKNTTNHKTDMFSFNTNNFGDSNRYGYQELNQMHDNGINKIKIKGGAFGCALIDVSVLNKLSYPWFQYVNYNNRQVLSEDLYFCNSINEIGGNVVLALDVRCGHLVRRFQYD